MISRTVNEPGINVWVRVGSSPNGARSGHYADIDKGGAQLGFDIPSATPRGWVCSAPMP